jgi:hypothetical protein
MVEDMISFERMPSLGRVDTWNVSQGLTQFQGADLARGFVVAGDAAGLAVHEAVLADPDLEYGLAEATVLIALALVFRHFALGATIFCGTGPGGHRNNLTLNGKTGNVPLVTGGRGAKLTSAAEAVLDLAGFMARLKSCPSRSVVQVRDPGAI